jgi:hypothetical protein
MVCTRGTASRCAAAARMLAVPGAIVVRLADPVRVAAAAALHFAPQIGGSVIVRPHDQPPPHVLGDLELGDGGSLG